MFVKRMSWINAPEKHPPHIPERRMNRAQSKERPIFDKIHEIQLIIN